MSSETLSNIDVVVYALADLGGGAREVPHEEVAYHAWKLAPDRFSWSSPEYRHFPDKELVRFGLEDAKKEQFGRLVAGSAKRGSWTLTLIGTKWFAQNQERLARQLRRPAKPSSRPREVQTVIKRIRAHALFRDSPTRGVAELTPPEFADFLGCSPDASPRVMTKKMLAYENAAEAWGDTEISQLLSQLKGRFRHMLEEGIQ